VSATRSQAGKPARATPSPVCPPETKADNSCATKPDKSISSRHGKLVGILSMRDLVKDIISEQKFVIEQLQHYITGGHG